MSNESDDFIHTTVRDLIKDAAVDFGISGTIDADGRIILKGVSLTRKEPETREGRRL